MICELASLLFGVGLLTFGAGLFMTFSARARMARAEERLRAARAKERRARELFNLSPYPYEPEEVKIRG